MNKKLVRIITSIILIGMLTITSFAGNNKYNGGNISRNIPSETFIQIYDKMISKKWEMLDF